MCQLLPHWLLHITSLHQYYEHHWTQFHYIEHFLEHCLAYFHFCWHILFSNSTASEFFIKHESAKWFSLPHFRQVFPYAEHLFLIWIYPHLWQFGNFLFTLTFYVVNYNLWLCTPFSLWQQFVTYLLLHTLFLFLYTSMASSIVSL